MGPFCGTVPLEPVTAVVPDVFLGAFAFIVAAWFSFLAYRTKRVGKTAVTVDKSRVIAVISCLKEDIGWTKCVGKNVGNH